MWPRVTLAELDAATRDELVQQSFPIVEGDKSPYTRLDSLTEANSFDRGIDVQFTLSI